MKLVRVASGMVNQTPLDWEGNRLHLVAAISQARDAGASILCLPELAISGYGCEDAFLSPGVGVRALEELQNLLPETEGMIVAVGVPVWHRNKIYDCAAVMANGELIGFAAKQYLAGDGLHYEPRWFKPWPNDVADEIEVGNISVPFGDLIFEFDGVRIGFEICEDAWVATRPGSDLSRRGVDLILSPSASHFAFGKQRIRERFVLEGSRAFGVTYLYTNLIGNESGRVIFDGGAIIASGGKRLATGKRLGFEDVEIVTAVVDIDHTRMLQARTVSHQPIVGDREELVVRREFSFPKVTPEFPGEEEEPRILSKEEEFTRAECLGLFDYMRKSYSQGFVVSLSGGADSAAVATLCALMVHVGIEELGLDGFLAKLGHIKFSEPFDQRRAVNQLLTCVYQATENSSETTETAARELAGALGADFHKWEIDHLVSGYRKMVEASLERELTWKRDDLALQNIQARVRAPGVWMMANIRGALLLATSNRSEAAVGYATMDGDTCGGLSPIGGIDKAFLREWLVWMEQVGAPGIPTVPELSFINVQDPTAELRPLETGQTDEGDLMPYPLLDAIERHAIRDKKLDYELVELIQAQFPQYAPEKIREWVDRFFRLWRRNQWKRERYAPSFHLDDESLDPKTWCRYPILSGG
ncbi:MAG: NAD+ synthase (glutamine-hydrolyzing) [Verrucomicrobiales bacterium]|jgi:NAD+ synthase (glutamine-hydrolysing)